MSFLSFISFAYALLTGIAFCAIGSLILRLRLAKIYIANETTDEDLKINEFALTDPITKPLEKIVPHTSKRWLSYEVKFEFSNILGTIGYLLIIIGLLAMVASFAVYVRIIGMESRMPNFH
jgi:hypothetical protein